MNFIEKANEYTLLFISYSLLILTDFVPDIQTKIKVGYFMIALTVLIILINVVIVIKDLYHHRQHILRQKKLFYEKQCRELKQKIMDKFTVREQHLIMRKIKSKKSIKNLKVHDLRAKRKFKKKYIANYSLSDIPEEEEKMELDSLMTEKVEL